METAFQFNNCGVELLESGSHNDAFHMFQGSMEIFSQLSSQHSASQPLHVNEEDDRIKQAKMIAVRYHKTNGSGPKQKIILPPFLHSKPMPLQATSEKFENGSYSDRTEVLQRYSAVVMFNFALTYHLKFFAGPSSHDLLLERAFRLYDMSCDLIAENSKGREQDMDYAVAIATLNNKAQIYHEFGNYAQSESLMETLQQLILSLDETMHQQSFLDGDNFLLNARLLCKPTMAAAA